MNIDKMGLKECINWQKFKKRYESDFTNIHASSKGEYYAPCTLCNVDISVKHSGEYDISRHFKSEKHVNMEKI